MPQFGQAPSGAKGDLFTQPRWYACYTRARHEKQVADLLEQRQIESYLPLIPRERQWKDRKKLVDFPLFPSYVFGRFTLADVHRVLSLPGVATIVRVKSQPIAIPEEDLENIRRFVKAIGESGFEPKPVPFVHEGERVRVREGPFRGVVGIVLELRNRGRILVGLEAIGQGMEIDIDAQMLEPFAEVRVR